MIPASKKARILSYIKSQAIEVSPKQIKEDLKLNYSTVRKYVRDLLQKGEIIQPYPGAYCSIIRHGMMMAPLRCHNVIVSVPSVWLDFSEDVEEWTGDVKIRIQYGLQRRRITGRISCDKGMSRDTLIFALNRFYDLVERKTSHSIEKLVLKTFELNRDFSGVRIDLGRCFTVSTFKDFILRLYQKEKDLVRKEIKVTREMDIEELYTLMEKGIPEFEAARVFQELRNKVDALLLSSHSSHKLLEAILNDYPRLKARVEKLEDNSKGYIA